MNKFIKLLLQSSILVGWGAANFELLSVIIFIIIEDYV